MKHVLFTLNGCPYELLDDELHIKAVLITAAEIAKSELLNIASAKFDPQGVTAVALLAESHISIHTWPELGQAICDVFTCGDHTEPELAAEYMRATMSAEDMISNTFLRPLQ